MRYVKMVSGYLGVLRSLWRSWKQRRLQGFSQSGAPLADQAAAGTKPPNFDRTHRIRGVARVRSDCGANGNMRIGVGEPGAGKGRPAGASRCAISSAPQRKR